MFIERFADRERNLLLLFRPLIHLAQFVVRDIVFRQIVAQRQIFVCVARIRLLAIRSHPFRFRFLGGILAFFQSRVFFQLMLHPFFQFDGREFQ